MAQSASPICPDEQERLQALSQYRVLDTEREVVFDNIASLAALICDVPIVAISLIDEKRQWFKSCVGLQITETPRDIAFCAHTIAGKQVLVVPDAEADPRFRENPLVKNHPEIRFYAGIPLITPEGFAIGTLAVLDRRPRKLNEQQLEALQLLAKQVMEQLELRRRAYKSQAVLQAVVNASPIAVTAVDLDRNVVMWNDHAEKIFGYKREEVLGKPVPTITPENARIIADVHERLVKGEAVIHFDNIKSLHKDGHTLETSLSVAAVRNEKGEMIGSVGMLEDITEQKRIERKLIQLGTVVEASGDAIIGGTLDGIITAWNRGAERLYGYTAEDMIGNSIGCIYPPDRQSERWWIIDNLKRGQSISTLETVRVRKDGTLVDVSVTVSPVKDVNGNPVGVSNVARDITGRKRAERELEKTLSLIKATLEATNDGIIAVDLKGNIVGMNQRFAEMWRLPKEIVESGSVQRGIQFVAEQLRDPEYFLEKTRRYFAGEQLDAFDILEFKDGRVLERYIHPQIVGGEIGGYVFSYRDMSRRRQLEEQLRQAQKMEAVGQLAGGIAHDFNNLLNVIIGYTELTKMRVPENDPGRANLDHVMKAAERAASLTRQLLIFSRKQVPQLEVIDLNTVVKNMSGMLRRLIGEDIELAISLGEDLGNMKADAGQVEQVVMNLAINARDAMPKGGKLQIRTKAHTIVESSPGVATLAPGEYIALEVEDTGQGIPEDVRAHIFEPFFTTKEPGKGTGLGLATVYGIVHQSSGDIEVQSKVGKGTTFRILFPKVREIASGSKTLPMEKALRGREVILVVEDEESLRKLISHALRQQGYTMLEARDGADALRVASEHKGSIDMLITDVVMPGMRGWELARKITASYPHVRVLYISGYADDVVLDPSVLGTNSGFLQKPFSPSTLAQKVRSFLQSEKRAING